MSNMLSIKDELDNFIEYWTSCEEMRNRMYGAALHYLQEVREEPPTVIFTKISYKGDDVYEKDFVGSLDPCKEKFLLTDLSAMVHKYQALGCVVVIR